MKEKIFIYPVGQYSNEQIAKHPMLEQEVPELNMPYYVGKNKIKLPTYQTPNLMFEGLKKSDLQFYAFKQKGKYSRRQYFYCQNVSKTDDALALKITELLSKLTVKT